MDKDPIEQKGITFDHDFGYSLPLFSSLLKKREEEKKMKSKNHDQKSCFSARSNNSTALRNLGSSMIFLMG